MVRPTVLEPGSSDCVFPNKRWLHFFIACSACDGPVDQQHRASLALGANCVRMDFVSQEDPGRLKTRIRDLLHEEHSIITERRPACLDGTGRTSPMEKTFVSLKKVLPRGQRLLRA